MSRLRPYQTALKQAVFDAWQRVPNVLIKAPTGAGKTVILADIVKTADRASAVIAHRRELVTQISTALAREGVRHRVVGSDTVRKNCVALHMKYFKRSFFDATARVGVCGVDTVTNRDMNTDSWFRQVGLWVQDEAHHVLKENKWGEAASMFPNAFGLGVTATPSRADGKGLGRHHDGLFDVMIQGPALRELIDAGYLTDYKVFGIPSDVDYSEVTVTASGELSLPKLRAAVHASDKIVGDVVHWYSKVCLEKLGRLGLGVTFAVDIEEAEKLVKAYRAAGIPAEIVTKDTPDLLRVDILKRFERREVLNLVNVDLFGEGFDLPAIEVVSMVRKTESWALFVQQFGRALRLMISDELMRMWDTLSPDDRKAEIIRSGKAFALIIDHVGNVIRHGVPDAPRLDTLDRRASRASSKDDAIPTRVCVNPDKNGDGSNEVCAKTYERFYPKCPFCGFVPVPALRSAPEHVDGDLFELDEATLAALRGKVIDLTVQPVLTPHGIHRGQQARNTSQHFLRELVLTWAGWHLHHGVELSETYRRFFHTFGVDVLTAQTLGHSDADILAVRIRDHLDQNRITRQ